MSKYLLALSLSLSLSVTGLAQSNHNFEVAKNLDIFNNLYKELDLYYVDTLDAQKVIKNAIDYMCSELDPYTAYYAPNQKDDLKQLTTGKYAGIGALIRYYKSADRVVIAEPFEGTPAALSGLRPGDIILKIDQKVFDKKGDKSIEAYTTEITNALRGEAGTTVKVTILRTGENKPQTVSIVRQSIRRPAIAYSKLLPDGIAYVMLAEYTENVARDLRRTLVDLKKAGATSLILDLRGNGGGLMSEAVSIVNMFIPKGKEVVRTDGKIPEVRRTYKTESEPFDTNMPIVVLVNSNTASAAEITSGTLQDYDRAIVMGQRTFGKGLVQIPRPLPYGAALKLTTSKYYIPSGRCVQKYDFKHRNADGSATSLPDSLAKIFYTANGRPVREHGGITPDVILSEDSLPGLLAYLSASEVLFDYANTYRHTHTTIAKAETFTISDADFDAFKKQVLASDFTYDRQSKRALSVLRRIAKQEGYEQDAEAEFAALEAKLEHNLDRDLTRWKPEIVKLINSEITNRYYYQRGALANALKHDKDIQAAAALLKDGSRYKELLAPPTKDN